MLMFLCTEVQFYEQWFMQYGREADYNHSKLSSSLLVWFERCLNKTMLGGWLHQSTRSVLKDNSSFSNFAHFLLCPLVFYHVTVLTLGSISPFPVSFSYWDSDHKLFKKEETLPLHLKDSLFVMGLLWLLYTCKSRCGTRKYNQSLDIDSSF